MLGCMKELGARKTCMYLVCGDPAIGPYILHVSGPESAHGGTHTRERSAKGDLGEATTAVSGTCHTVNKSSHSSGFTEAATPHESHHKVSNYKYFFVYNYRPLLVV